MDDIRKRAYRYLLYHALLEIRSIESATTSSEVRKAAVIANWLHNLAIHSAHEFVGFDEENFWRQYDTLNERNPDLRLPEFKWVFENVLAGKIGLHGQ